MNKLFIIVAATVFISLLAGTVHAQEDPRLGTWALNVAKSKYDPGPAPASETRTYSADGLMTKVNIETVDNSGKHQVTSYSGRDDGKDYPMIGVPFADMATITRVDANTFHMDTKKSGKVIGTAKVEVSKDGKMMTITSEMNVAGRVFKNTAVFDKQ